MYAGHFAIGVALSSRFRDVPAWIPLFGVAWLDLVHAVLVAVGVERVTSGLPANGYLHMKLDFIDWDHSLAMAIVWSMLAGLAIWRGKSIWALSAVVGTVAVFSHFLADALVHDPDLALWPHSPIHVGFGLWSSLPVASWFLEVGFVVALAWYGARVHPRKWDALQYPLALMFFLALQLTPWWSLIQLAGSSPLTSSPIVHGVFLLVGFILPAGLMSWLLRRPPVIP
ncbi:hypothetical protein [Pendulispora albinea]|uniref:Metal-dependent hydrolase n=1 Tax=Pendulispora albinea TaxID=2741071 RepID=A0ABZ2M592_9BACT